MSRKNKSTQTSTDQQPEPEIIIPTPEQTSAAPAGKWNAQKLAYTLFWAYIGVAAIAGIAAPRLFNIKEAVLEQYLMIGFVPVLLGVLIALKD